jgi:predicted nucleic acid-binding protein
VLSYLDTSVAIAHLLSESRRPPATLWDQELVSSRLLQYELWTRINSRGLTTSHSELVRALLALVSMVELADTVLTRALEPFPLPVRTLDALHLATIEFLRAQGRKVELASYDERMLAAARGLGVPAAAL